VDFIAHGGLYTAFLAHWGNLTEQRREELRDVWSSLTLRPIPTGDESATRLGGRPVLEDGYGNPPVGWGNPFQPGVMALTSPDHAEFESRDGALEATFRPRTAAGPPAQPCA
jgi:hypothetical protein